jgi:hypothetical protein
MPAVKKETVSVKVSPKISYGFISVAGLVAALAQYLTALGTATANGEINGDTIGLIATATLTFLGVAAGRYKQASDAIKNMFGRSSWGAAGPQSALTPQERAELAPEANVLYLDGDAIAAAVVKSLNTKAVLASMTAAQAEPTPAETATAPTEV